MEKRYRSLLPVHGALLFLALLLMTVSLTRCAGTGEELHHHGEMTPVKTFPKDYVHPLADINLEKVINENRGLKVYPENATTVHDYYRGGVQEKAQAERLLKEGRWEEAEGHFDQSIRFLQVVLRYSPEDEAYRNIYGDHVVIFLPNLLMADNFLKLVTLYSRIGRDDKIVQTRRYGEYYLEQSLKRVRTEWALEIRKGFEGSDRK